MKRRLLVVCFSLMFVATALIPASSAEDFQVMWAMEVPRATYFIGETVSFTVTAFASTDPSLKLPGEMALVTIRNESLVEVYSAWITTNANGSSPVNYEIDLTADTGNYTIILDAIQGENVHESFNVLFNEETYWKERVDRLEEEQQQVYDHLNYLFNYDRWLTRELGFWKNVVKWTFILTFVVLFIGLWVFFPQLAQRSRTEKGIYAQMAKGLSALGLSAEPRIYLEHEEVAQLEVPPDKAAPRMNAKNYCPVCDHDLKNPMTLVQFEDHIKMHDQDYLGHSAWRGKFRKAREDRKKKRDAEPEKPMVTFGTEKEYSDKWNDKQKATELKVRLKVLKDLKKKNKITPQRLSEELNKAKAEVAEIKKTKETRPAPREPTSQKTISYRKVKDKLPISGVLKTPSGIPNNKTLIDELYDKLSNEKVN